MKFLFKCLVALAIIAGGQAPMLACAAALQVTESTVVLSDSVNTLLPKAMPGAILEVTVVVTNPAFSSTARLVSVTNNMTSVLNSIAVPRGAEYYVGDLSAATVFDDGSVLGLGGSGLSYTFAGLGNAGDSISFSKDGVDFNYTPQPNGDGYDPLISHIRISPTGNFAAATQFSFRLRLRVKQ